MIVQGELLFCVDVMPTEQGAHVDQDFFCYTACAVSKWNDRANVIRQYKDHTERQRKEIARLLCELVCAEEIFLLPACIMTRQEDARHNGEMLLRNVLGLESCDQIERPLLEAAGFDLSVSRAIYYANYAIALSFLARRAGWYAKQLNLKKTKLILDLLPGDRRDGPQPGMETLKRLVDKSPYLLSIWRETGVDFQLSEIGFAYSSRNDLPGDVIVDWLAQSYHAAINSGTFRMNINRNREERRRAAADLLFALLEKFREKWNQKYVEPLVLPRISDGLDKPATLNS